MDLSLRTTCQVDYGAAHSTAYRPAFSFSHFTIPHLRETQSHGLSVRELWSFIRPCSQSCDLIAGSKPPREGGAINGKWEPSAVKPLGLGLRLLHRTHGVCWYVLATHERETKVMCWKRKMLISRKAERLWRFCLWAGTTARKFLTSLFLSWDLGTVSLLNSLYSLLQRGFITVGIHSNHQWTQTSTPQFFIEWCCSSI